MPENSDIQDINKNCVVSKYEHSKACSSSYWDRSGAKVLTTSYDDLIRGRLHSLSGSALETHPTDASRLSVFDINPRKLGQYLEKDLVPSARMPVSLGPPFFALRLNANISSLCSTTAKVRRPSLWFLLLRFVR